MMPGWALAKRPRYLERAPAPIPANAYVFCPNCLLPNSVRGKKLASASSARCFGEIVRDSPTDTLERLPKAFEIHARKEERAGFQLVIVGDGLPVRRGRR